LLCILDHVSILYVVQLLQAVYGDREYLAGGLQHARVLLLHHRHFS